MAVSVLRGRSVLSNIIAVQDEHSEYGGVVPEIASRAHQRTVSRTVTLALETAGVRADTLEAIAVTKGPGLPGSLIVGNSFARAFADGLQIPLIGVNHLDGHIYSVFLDQPGPNYPFITLIVSGGHTQLVKVNAPFSHEVLGKTRDDAAGEAFDKVGKLFGLEYPAGPMIDKLSTEGDPTFFSFPRSSIPAYDFSFSGIKTSALYYLNSHPESERKQLLKTHLNDLCASFQQSIVDMLLDKFMLAIQSSDVAHASIVGGVSANRLLRNSAVEAADKMGVKLHFPAKEYCTDNAAMIGAAALAQIASGHNMENDFVIAPNLPL